MADCTQELRHSGSAHRVSSTPAIAAHISSSMVPGLLLIALPLLEPGFRLRLAQRLLALFALARHRIADVGASFPASGAQDDLHLTHDIVVQLRAALVAVLIDPLGHRIYLRVEHTRRPLEARHAGLRRIHAGTPRARRTSSSMSGGSWRRRRSAITSTSGLPASSAAFRCAAGMSRAYSAVINTTSALRSASLKASRVEVSTGHLHLRTDQAPAQCGDFVCNDRYFHVRLNGLRDTVQNQDRYDQAVDGNAFGEADEHQGPAE